MKKPFSLYMFIFFTGMLIFSDQHSLLELKKKVQEIGQLTFKKEVPVKFVSRKQLAKYIEQVFSQQVPDEKAEKEAVYLKLMGFTNRMIDVRRWRQKIMLANMGGLYRDKSGDLYVLDELRQMDDINSMIVVHQLRCAILDQYYPLAKLLGDRSVFDDRKLALLAAIEGDAIFVMLKSGGFIPELFTGAYGTDTLLSFSPLKNTAILYQAPDIIKFQFIMPYYNGLGFINTLFKKRKWKSVNKILAAPPQSTEQILHPKKYLRGEAPISVLIGYKPQDFCDFYSGVIGEYYLNLLLKSGESILDPAMGWGGDLLKIFRRGDDYFLIWKSRWDKEKYCASFFVDFKKFLEKKYAVNFKKGLIKSQHFIAGESKFGYFFLTKGKDKLYYVRSSDRVQINEFIKGGIYD